MQHQRMSLYSDRLSIEFDAKYMHNHRRAKNGKLHARVQRNQWGGRGYLSSSSENHATSIGTNPNPSASIEREGQQLMKTYGNQMNP